MNEDVEYIQFTHFEDINNTSEYSTCITEAVLKISKNKVVKPSRATATEQPQRDSGFDLLN